MTATVVLRSPTKWLAMTVPRNSISLAQSRRILRSRVIGYESFIRRRTKTCLGRRIKVDRATPMFDVQKPLIRKSSEDVACRRSRLLHRDRKSVV